LNSRRHHGKEQHSNGKKETSQLKSMLIMNS